jgi:hypothetical protein
VGGAKRVAAVDAEALAPAPRRTRAQGSRCSAEVAPKVMPVVVLSRENGTRADATPAVKVARCGRWDDAGCDAREERR